MGADKSKRGNRTASKQQGLRQHGSPHELYRRARELVIQGDHNQALELYDRLGTFRTKRNLAALVANDRGVIAAIEDDLDSARRHFQRALTLNSDCAAARANLDVIEDVFVRQQGMASTPRSLNTPRSQRTKVLVASFLFNWPSTGGGIIHTVELCRFLEQAGYSVKLIHARYEPWNIGSNDGTCPFAAEPIEFDPSNWNAADIEAAFRSRAQEFAPDSIIITDSWNSKPLLARAFTGFRYFLRMQAQECLCPLNNLRLLPSAEGTPVQCGNHQFLDPPQCHRCVERWDSWSGSLHRAERQLCGFGTKSYTQTLQQSFRDAAGVLTLNQSSAELLRPYAQNVQVVTWGMDPARFPWQEAHEEQRDGPTKLLFAGLVGEPIKGYAILRQACRTLWQTRKDFELLITADHWPVDDEFVRPVGWLSQADVPACHRSADITIVPSIAQEGLSRTAVEAMGAGRAVIGSRIGGLPEVVIDGETGLLCAPGDPAHLARAISTLLDQPQLRTQFGNAGRKRFEERFLWPAVIERDYLPLLGQPIRYREAGR